MSAVSGQRAAPALVRRDSNILAVVIARIGDTLLATPALAAMKAAAPDGRLSVLAHPKRIDVLRNLEFIDELRGMSHWSAVAGGRLGTERHDLAFVYGHDQAPVRYALRTSGKVIAFRQGDEGLDQSLAIAVPEPEPTPHAIQHRLLLTRAAGIDAQDLRLQWRVSSVEAGAAAAWRAGNVPGGAAPVAGFQMRSFPTKAHRDWPVARFAEFAAHLLGTFPGAHIVALGDDAARPAAEELLQAHPGRVSIAAGRLKLRDSAALMQGLDLYVGVDTGPTHIAGALGIPMVALYHCAYPGRNLAPLGHSHCRVIEHPLTGHGGGSDASMADIGADIVWRAASEFLPHASSPLKM